MSIIQGSKAQSGNFVWAGAWPFGTSEAVAIDTVRSYGYLSSGGAVIALDITDPLNPVALDSNIRTSGQVLDIHVDYSNNNLLLACDEAGMEIWDVDDVENPSKISSLEIIYGGAETPVRHIELYGDFAVTENRWGYVHTVDISDPANPFQVAFNGVMGNPAHDISVSQDGYIHATGQQYFVLLMINADGSLNLAANYYYYNAGSVFGNVEASFFHVDGYLYVIDRINGGTATTPAVFHDIVVRNDLAYMIGDEVFMIYDVSDLGNPTFVSQITVSGVLGQLDIMGDRAYISCGYQGMRVIDISDPSSPVEISSTEGTGVTWASQRSGNYCYLANSVTGISIIDISDPMGDGPEKIAGIPSNDETRDLAIQDNTLFFADYGGGLRIYDITDPENPGQTGSISVSNAWRVDVSGNSLFLDIANPNLPDTLIIYDVSNPANPVMESSMLLPDLIWKVLFYEDHLYIAAHEDGLLVVDVTDESNPVQVAMVDLPDVSDIDIENDTAYVASTDWDGGLVTLDVSDPSNPQVLNIYNPSGWYHPFYVAVEGDYAYTGENFGDLKMFDVSDPLNPQVIDEYVTSGSIVQMTATGNYLYVSDGPDGLQIMHNEIGGVTAAFTADEQSCCEGGTVNFTDESTGGVASWAWAFEGGTPGSSTEQNPSVTYNSAGNYDVELIVSDGVSADTLLESGFITVSVAPAQAGMPSGPEETCQNGVYNYTVSPVAGAAAYEWQVDPSDAGTISPNDTTAIFVADSNWTGSYSVMARATNDCGDGPWSPPLPANLNYTPEIFTFTGGGTYCEGTGGLELILDGSEAGIDYELYLDTVSTGTVLAGTGDPLNFGYHTDPGVYTVTGYTITCSSEMEGENIIAVQAAPGQALMPEGDQMVCNDQVTEYTSAGATDADFYTWILSPDQAGTLFPDSLAAEVAWSQEFTGTAMLSLYGSNECGDGPPSDELIISVSQAPSPEISGPDTTCSGATATYMADNNPGSIYSWIVYGGELVEGDSTYQVIVRWGEAGEGNLVVTEETGEGCIAASDEYEVNIMECTQIDELSSMMIEVYPNPAQDILHVSMPLAKRSKVDVVLLDIAGKKLGHRSFDAMSGRFHFQYSVAHLERGVYIVRITVDDKAPLLRKVLKIL